MPRNVASNCVFERLALTNDLLERHWLRPAVCQDLHAHGEAAGRLSVDSYLARIATESSNILLYPIQRQSLISYTRIC